MSDGKPASVDAKQEQMPLYEGCGADTGSRLILVLSPRGSHHLTLLNLPGQCQHPQHLATDISRLKKKSWFTFRMIPCSKQIKAALKGCRKCFLFSNNIQI